MAAQPVSPARAGKARVAPRPLLPVAPARLIALGLFGLLGSVHWARMVEHASGLRTVAAVVVALGAGVAVLVAERAPGRWRSPAVLAVTVIALAGALLVAGIPLRLLWVREWDTLASGIGSGMESLSNVRLPYRGVDQWPRLALQAGVGWLLVLAALLAVWPRPDGGRGYPLVSGAALVSLVAVPAVSLGNERPVAVGALLAAATILFLFIDRLPTRPGIGVAALAAAAVLAALPLASTVDRDGPWFDYQAFAESVGPEDPVHFKWEHSYGPITFPRDGREIMRVESEEPHYWKAENLEYFDGAAWVQGGFLRGEPAEDLTERWFDTPGWTHTFRVKIRRLRSRDVIGAGTVLEVPNTTRRVEQDRPGTFVTSRSELRRGDSYEVKAHIPRPNPGQLVTAEADPGAARASDLRLDLPLLGTDPSQPQTTPPSVRELLKTLELIPGEPPPSQLRIIAPSFEQTAAGAKPTVNFPEAGIEDQPADLAMRATPYRRTWRLAQRLRAGANTPYAYLLAVNKYLHEGFSYDERPEQPAPGRAPLDAFLFDSKSGYCQHFSGAMALLLRMGGIPARVASGFSPGGYSKRNKEWVVRDTDAHSWVEAWFDKYGWVTFDPTPEGTPARSQIAVLQDVPQRVADAAGAAAGAAGGGTGAVGGRRGTELRGDLRFDQSGRGAVPGGGSAERGTPWVRIGVGAGVGVVLVLLALLFLRRRRTRRAWARTVGPAEVAVAELRTALRRTGRILPAPTTLTELERRYGGTPEAAAYLRALRAARYGGNGAHPTTGQRRALRRELAEGLGVVGRVRALWALPPRRG